MVSTPYYRGRAKEYKVMEILRKDGWLCSRSAMSHGPVDIFAGKDGKTFLIAGAVSFGAESAVWYVRKKKEILREKVASL